MRLCLVSQEYPPETAHGGIGAQTHVKAHGLARLGHEVHVVSHSVDGERHEYRDGAVQVVRIAPPDERLPVCTDVVRWISHSESVAAEVARLHARAPLDLVDFPEWGCEAYIHLLNRTPWNWVRTVIHLHGPLVMFARKLGWPEPDSILHEIGSGMERTCLRLADAVFSSSDCSADWCAAEYGLDRDAIPTLHSGVDLALFRPLEMARDARPTILFVGKIARSKGIVLLVEAALRLAAQVPGLRLRLIGRGDAALLATLAEQACVQGFPELIEYAGFVPREALPAELSRADLFAAPSFYEGGPGFVYLEAMACGLPVVACDGSGASEAVRHESNGLLVPPGDVDALAHALRRLLTDERLRARLSRGARDFVAREADSEDCLRRLEAYYRSLVAQPVPAR